MPRGVKKSEVGPKRGVKRSARGGRAGTSTRGRKRKSPGRSETPKRGTGKRPASADSKREDENTNVKKAEQQELLLKMPHPKQRDPYISTSGYKQHIDNNIVRVENDMDASEAVVKSEEELIQETCRLRAERDALITMEARRFIWTMNIEPVLQSLSRDTAKAAQRKMQVTPPHVEAGPANGEAANGTSTDTSSEAEVGEDAAEEELDAKFTAFAAEPFQVGMELEVFQKKWKTWFESKIEEIISVPDKDSVESISKDGDPDDKFRVHIHFFGWAKKHRIWLDIKRGDLEPDKMRELAQFAPPRTHTSGVKFGSRRSAMLKEKRLERERALAERKALDNSDDEDDDDSNEDEDEDEDEDENEDSDEDSDDDDDNDSEDDDEENSSSGNGDGASSTPSKRSGRRSVQEVRLDVDLSNVVDGPRQRRRALDKKIAVPVAFKEQSVCCFCGEKHYKRDLNSTEELWVCQLGCGRAFHGPCYKEITEESIEAATVHGSLECAQCRKNSHNCYACVMQEDADEEEIDADPMELDSSSNEKERDDEDSSGNDSDDDRSEDRKSEASDSQAASKASGRASASTGSKSQNGVKKIEKEEQESDDDDEEDPEDKPIKCSVAGCTHFYHPSCVWDLGARCRVIAPNGKTYPATKENFKRVATNLPNGMICPQHGCRACYDRNPNSEQAFKKPHNLVPCITCNNAFHERCLPHGGLQNGLGLVCNSCAREYDAPLSGTTDTHFLMQKAGRRSGLTKFDPCRHLQSLYKNMDMSGPLTARMRLPELQEWHNEMAEKSGIKTKEPAPKKVKVKKEKPSKAPGKSRMPKYNPIKSNLYVTPCKPILNTDLLESTCKCKDVCGENCDNHMLRIECVREGDRGSKSIPVNCTARACKNQQFQQGKIKDVKPIETPGRGWGLELREPAHEGDFIIEYVGEVLTAKDARRRMEQAMANNEPHVFQLDLGNDQIIDARHKGNLARFVNHSCDPNCALQKWNVRGVTRVGIIAKRRIEAGEELSFDYSFEQSSDLHFHCLCGAPNCRGTLTAISSKSSQAKLELERVCQDINRLKNLRADVRGGLLPCRQLRHLVKQARSDWEDLREKQAAYERRVNLRIKRALPASRTMLDVSRITSMQKQSTDGYPRTETGALIFLHRNVSTGADMQRRAKLFKAHKNK